jgi:hypothetical protein
MKRTSLKARPHYSCLCYSLYALRVNIRILTRRNLASNWSSVDENLRTQVKARRVSRRAPARARVMWSHLNESRTRETNYNYIILYNFRCAPCNVDISIFPIASFVSRYSNLCVLHTWSKRANSRNPDWLTTICNGTVFMVTFLSARGVTLEVYYYLRRRIRVIWRDIFYCFLIYVSHVSRLKCDTTTFSLIFLMSQVN